MKTKQKLRYLILSLIVTVVSLVICITVLYLNPNPGIWFASCILLSALFAELFGWAWLVQRESRRKNRQFINKCEEVRARFKNVIESEKRWRIQAEYYRGKSEEQRI